MMSLKGVAIGMGRDATCEADEKRRSGRSSDIWNLYREKASTGTRSFHGFPIDLVRGCCGRCEDVRADERQADN